MLTRVWTIALVVFAATQSVQAQELCTYQTYSWNTVSRQAVNRVSVNKAYSELTISEIDQFTGCSVCEQDQRVIKLPPLAPFRVCHVIAPQLENLLRKMISRGEPIRQVQGYRVGKTRGEVDANGLRKLFSNHSFGIAVDINPANNGLYDNCLEFSNSCRIIRGGAWNLADPFSLAAESNIVTKLKSLGLKWGGEIKGSQKDFMHFSPTGY